MTPPRVEIEFKSVATDPDVKVGGFLLLQRADGRSLWQQRFICTSREPNKYVFSPVDEWGKPS